MVILNKMFRPHYDDPLNPDILTWIEAKAHMGIAGGLTSFIDNGSLKLPSIYDGLPIDYQTLYWDEIKEEVGTDEEGNPIYKTTKVLKAKGGDGGNTGGNSIQFALNWKGFSEGSWDGSQSATILIPTIEEIKNEIDKLYLPLTGGYLTGSLEIYGELLVINANKSYDISAERIQADGNVSGIARSWTNCFMDSDNNIRPKNGLSMFDSTNYNSVILAGEHGITFKTDNSPFYFDGGNVGVGRLAESQYRLDVNGNARIDGDIYINGGIIKYNTSGRYFYLEGDLLVSGGITSFASEEGFEPSTIMDALRVDGTNLEVVNGVLTFIGTTGDGTGGLDETAVKGIIESYKYVKADTLNMWAGSANIKTVGTITSGTWQGTPISNSKLANNSIEIAGTKVSLGSSITSSSLKTALGLNNTLTMDAVDVYISALQNQIDGLWKRNWFNDLHSAMLMADIASVSELYGDNIKVSSLRIGDCVLSYDSENNALTIQRKDGTAMNVLVTGGLTSYSTKV